MPIQIPEPNLPAINPQLVQALSMGGTPRSIALGGDAIKDALSAYMQGKSYQQENMPIDPALAARLGINPGTPGWLARQNAPLYEAASKTLSPGAASLMFGGGGGGPGTPGTSSSATPGSTPDFTGIPIDVALKKFSEDQDNARATASRNQTQQRMDFEQHQGHQDTLENQARQQLISIRGDQSLRNIEEQRDAAITAYNRIGQIEKSGQGMNPIDYVDILGQVYKARTGQAPTNEVLASARQATLQGSIDKAFTYMTGQQAPATTPAIMASLKSMVFNMGKQADTIHDGYMRTRLTKPTGLDDDRWQSISAGARGISFQDGISSPQSSNAPTNPGSLSGNGSVNLPGYSSQ